MYQDWNISGHVLGVSILPVSKIFQLDFGASLTSGSLELLRQVVFWSFSDKWYFGASLTSGSLELLRQVVVWSFSDKWYFGASPTSGSLELL